VHRTPQGPWLPGSRVVRLHRAVIGPEEGFHVQQPDLTEPANLVVGRALMKPPFSRLCS
jgi:hypothetical protein